VSIEPTEELTDAPFREGDAGIGSAGVQVDAIAVDVEGVPHGNVRTFGSLRAAVQIRTCERVDGGLESGYEYRRRRQ
jgi:hypothetical protein